MLDVLREKGNPSRASIARDALVDIGSRSAQRTWNVVTTDRWSDAKAVPASRLLMAPHTAPTGRSPSSEAQQQIVGMAVTE